MAKLVGNPALKDRFLLCFSRKRKPQCLLRTVLSNGNCRRFCSLPIGSSIRLPITCRKNKYKLTEKIISSVDGNGRRKGRKGGAGKEGPENR
jgi:hypothetical protein